MRLVEDGSIRLSALFLSPFRRLAETPEGGMAAAGLAALGQWMIGGLFGVALLLVLATAFIDWLAGVVTAHRLHEYKAGIAYNGALSKLLGLVLVMLVRALEGFIAYAGLLDSNGWLATAAAVSLVAVDLVSIAKHRRRLGGEPIPFITALTDWLQASLIDKLPGRRPAREGEE
jgi:phage-related holin